MLYKELCGEKLSALGLGTLRLPVVDGVNANIDQERTNEMVDYALAHGVNYFDTAWAYHGGHSEEAIGAALTRHPRESYYLCDKFPGNDLSCIDKVEEIFEAQLKRCGVEYFDFYFFHNVCEINIEQYLDPKYRVYDYLMEQKRRGRIRHLGFSTHGELSTMRRFLDAYGKDLELCQLQVNFLDWEFQGAKEKVELVQSYGIPVWVMEPLRGGKLAAMQEEDAAVLQALRPEESIPGWGFRFLQTVENIGVVLSGMSNMEQMKANVEIFSAHKPLTGEEMEALLGVARQMTGRIVLPCTACRYCESHCPQGLKIPDLLELYNEICFTGGGFLVPLKMKSVDKDHWPDQCLGCRSCEEVCPQYIKISEAMADFTKRLG